jgi:hypothetical protein
MAAGLRRILQPVAPGAVPSVQVQGIDSDVRRWDGPPRQSVGSDAGFYANRLDGEDLWEVCLDGDDETEPRIVLLRGNGGYGAGLYWPHPSFGEPRHPAQVQRFAVGVIAWSRRMADLPELLAIVRSVRLNPKPQTSPAAERVAAPDNAH